MKSGASAGPQDAAMQEIYIPQGMEGLCATYNHAPALRVGSLVWTSGQVGMTDAGEIPSSIAEQAHLAFGNLKRVLECAGATLADIVELQTFHVGLPEGAAEFRAAKDQFLSHNPAWTAVGVSYVALPGVRLEIKAVAVVGSGG